MDYTPVGFVENAPPYVSGANLQILEAGITDANNDQEYGTRAALPAATAAKKNHIYWAFDTGERFKCDGTQWLPLTVGTAGLKDGAVTGVKLDAAITGVLPTAGQKASLPGLTGQQNFGGLGYNAPPDVQNPYVLASALRSFLVDIPGAGTSATQFETGLWLVSSVYGFQDDANTTRASIVMMSFSTGGEGLKGCLILASVGYARNVTTSHTAIHDSAAGGLQITTSHGNTRTFFRSLRPLPSGGAGAKGT